MKRKARQCVRFIGDYETTINQYNEYGDFIQKLKIASIVKCTGGLRLYIGGVEDELFEPDSPSVLMLKLEDIIKAAIIWEKKDFLNYKEYDYVINEIEHVINRLKIEKEDLQYRAMIDAKKKAR